VLRARALYAFESSRSDELSFQAGEFLIIADGGQEGWKRGARRSNRADWGLVPINYIQILGEDALLPEPEVRQDSAASRGHFGIH
jgi:hypothetical protein